MKDKILRIIRTYIPNTMYAEDVTSEIESLIKENYVEKEFVEWLEWDEETNHFYKDFTTNMWMCADDNLPERTNEEVYQYWKLNIKDK